MRAREPSRMHAPPPSTNAQDDVEKSHKFAQSPHARVPCCEHHARTARVIKCIHGLLLDCISVELPQQPSLLRGGSGWFWGWYVDTLLSPLPAVVLCAVRVSVSSPNEFCIYRFQFQCSTQTHAHTCASQYPVWVSRPEISHHLKRRCFS